MMRSAMETGRGWGLFPRIWRGRLRLVYVGTNPYWSDKYGSHYSYDSHGNITVFEEWINNRVVTAATFNYNYQNHLTTCTRINWTI
jgi:hypothetical protein